MYDPQTESYQRWCLVTWIVKWFQHTDGIKKSILITSAFKRIDLIDEKRHSYSEQYFDVDNNENRRNGIIKRKRKKIHPKYNVHGLILKFTEYIY